MPTIVDVARHAAVSTATVSRVLNNNGQVSAETRERVLRAVDHLNYALNRAARTLRTFRSAKILVTVPDISNPFFAYVIRGAEEAAREAGFSLILGDTRHDSDLENQYAAMLLQREVDGLIFLGHRVPDVVRRMIEDDTRATLVVNGCEYSDDLQVPSVHIDNSRAGEDVIDHLVDLGHRSIGIVTGPLISPISRDRLDGVRSAMARHRLQERLQVQSGDFTVTSGHAISMALIAGGATAIFCFSDEMAIGALRAVEDSGLSCPGDISIVGFDDIRLANYMRPTLTTVRQPTTEIGAIAVRSLLSLIDGEEVPMTITLAHHLVIRDSTGPARKSLSKS